MMHNNSVSWNMGILQKLIDFANETSIHCLSFVVQTSASKLKRLTWAFLFVASLYYASFQLKQAFQCKFFTLYFYNFEPSKNKHFLVLLSGLARDWYKPKLKRIFEILWDLFEKISVLYSDWPKSWIWQTLGHVRDIL